MDTASNDDTECSDNNTDGIDGVVVLKVAGGEAGAVGGASV